MKVTGTYQIAPPRGGNHRLDFVAVIRLLGPGRPDACCLLIEEYSDLHLYHLHLMMACFSMLKKTTGPLSVQRASTLPRS